MKLHVLGATILLGTLLAAMGGHVLADDDGNAEPERPSPDQEAFIWEADDDELEWMPCPEFMPEGCRLAVLQGDPTEENADVFFRLAPDSKVPEHWHTSAERMVLISGELHVDYEGQDPVVMNSGTYAYGPKGLPHTTYCAEGEECILFIAFEEAVDAHPH